MVREILQKLAGTLRENGCFGRQPLDETSLNKVRTLAGRTPEGPLSFYPRSLAACGKSFAVMAAVKGQRMLAILTEGSARATLPPGFHGEELSSSPVKISLCPLTHENAAALRLNFLYTAPRTLGTAPAFGMGYRPPWGTGNAAQAAVARDLGIRAMLAQQSAREVERTARTFQDVVDRASWAAFEANLRLPWGADGDHLMTEEQVRQAVEAGCTYFTYDPSSQITNRVAGKDAGSLTGRDLEHAFEAAMVSESERRALLERYSGRPFSITKHDGSGEISYCFQPEDTMRIAVRYWKALELAEKLHSANATLKGKETFDSELSVDETEEPTTLEAQIFISTELERRSIRLTSLAPRFPGNFEKAIDYYHHRDPATGQKVCDTEELEHALRDMVAVARHFGYKISVHSGSDKFSIYPTLGKISGERLHLKTAGTTYVEEIRVVARFDPSLFREIAAYSLQEFEQSRKTYQLSTDLGRIPDLRALTGEELSLLLASGSGSDDLRQVIHVGYGAVLTALNPTGSPLFAERIATALRQHEEEQFETIAAHMRRHLGSIGPACFSAASQWFNSSNSRVG